MKFRNINFFIAALFALALFAGAHSARACDGLPTEVSTLMEEWEAAGVKTDCTVTRLMNWAVTHNSGDAVSTAIKLLNAYGYQNSIQLPSYTQSSFDAWRKKEGGVAAAFKGWKGSTATVVYLPAKKEYTLVQYRDYPKSEASAFSIKLEYETPFSDEQKKQIEEAAGWWKDRIGDKFEITLHISLDPSISAGGTTLVGNVPRSCVDHQPQVAEIKLKTVNPSLVSHEIGHALGIGTASVFKADNVCTMLAKASKDIPEISVSSARIENGKFYGTLSKGVALVGDSDGDFGHVSADAKDDDGKSSAVQPGLGGMPSLIDLRILEDLGYEIK